MKEGTKVGWGTWIKGYMKGAVYEECRTCEGGFYA